MSSPVSVTIANMVVESVEEKALSSVSIPVNLYSRYVDDPFTIVQKNTLKYFTKP